MDTLNREVRGDEEPGTEPVSAAPQLYSLEAPELIEISWAARDIPNASLEAERAALLSHFRRQTGQSPLANFGGDNSSEEPLERGEPQGHPSDPEWPKGSEWAGFDWSQWDSLETRLSEPRPEGPCVYIIKESQGVEYIGSTSAPTARFRDHERSFGNHEYCYAEVPEPALWEYEADVIGSYILSTQTSPIQFQRL